MWSTKAHWKQRAELCIFTDQCVHLCWKPLIHCLYQIDHVVVVQLPPYIQSWQAHFMFHFVPLPSTFFWNNTNYRSSNDILMLNSLALIRAFERFLLNVSCHFGNLLPTEQGVGFWRTFCCLKPQHAVSLHHWNACRHQTTHLYHINTQAQTDTCDSDGIQPSLADLKNSLRD